MDAKKLTPQDWTTLPMEELERLLREIMQRLDEEQEIREQRALAVGNIVARAF
jgi:hypothetical protein